VAIQLWRAEWFVKFPHKEKSMAMGKQGKPGKAPVGQAIMGKKPGGGVVGGGQVAKGSTPKGIGAGGKKNK
jgi:hypothetical protein